MAVPKHTKHNKKVKRVVENMNLEWGFSGSYNCAKIVSS